MKSDVGPAAYIPLWIVLHKDLPHGAKVLWALLHGAWTDRDGVGNPPRSQLAHDLNVSVPTVDRYLRLLVDAKAISVIPRKGSMNTYSVHLSRVITGDEGGVITGDDPHADNYPTDSELRAEGQKKKKKTVRSTENSKVLVLKRFDQFWSKYPRKLRIVAAKRKLAKLGIEENTDLWVKVISGLERSKRAWEAEGQELRYIPHAVTWLHQARWEDECDEAVSPPVSKATRSLAKTTELFLDRYGSKK